MFLLALAGLILPLALDTFAVSAAVGLARPTRRQRWRLSGLFALFEGGMPAIGVLIGGPLGRALGGPADLLAIAILIAFGVYTLVHSEGDAEDRPSRILAAHGPALILIGLSVSLDELAIGFTIGLLNVPVLPVLIAIGAQTFVATQVGLRIGASVSSRFREGAERLAGVALIALGVVLLIEHVMGATG